MATTPGSDQVAAEVQDLRSKIEAKEVEIAAKEAEIKEQQVHAAKADPALRLVLEQQVAADEEQVAALQKEVLVLQQKGERLDTQQSAAESKVLEKLDELADLFRHTAKVLAEGLAVEVSKALVKKLAGAFIYKVDRSRVSQSTEYTAVLEGLGLKVSELTLEAAVKGGGLAAALAGLPELPQSEAEFRMEKYPDEEAATVPFQQHLRRVLARLCGSASPYCFAESTSQQWPWALEDIRSQKLSWLSSKKKLCQGSMGLGIFPLDTPADITQLQIGLELQHTEEHKLLYEQNRARVARAERLGVPRVAAPAQPAAAGGPRRAQLHKRGGRRAAALPRRAGPSPSTAQQTPTGVAWGASRTYGRGKGQPTMEFRACEWPLDVVVTDGCNYHLLRLRGRDVQAVLNLSATDGLRLIAARLQQIGPSPTSSIEANTSTFGTGVVAARTCTAVKSAPPRKPADTVTATALMWQQIEELAAFQSDPEERFALVMEFLENNPQRLYEVPPALQGMLD